MLSKIKHLSRKNRILKQIIYFCYLIYEKFISFIYLCFRIYPIKNDKIVFCANKGDRFGDNPLSVTNALLNNNNDLDIVWLINKGVSADIPSGIKRVNNGTLAGIKELATARVWVDSNHKYSGFLKRKGQLYVQTWHGSYGLKKIGFDMDNNPPIDKRNFLYNSKYTDVMVSNSKRYTDIFRNAFKYDGYVIEKGSPRNDILLSSDQDAITQKVFNYYGINNAHIVLYAPTFREDYSTDQMKLDFERLYNILQMKTGENWVVFIRMHYKNLSEAKEFITYNEKIINASEYNDMQELIIASDILITDYSSCMFDFATTRKPCFIYASDLEKYNHDRGNYFTMEELPFPLSKNNDELEASILNFDAEIYQNNLDALFNTVGLNESGHASYEVADYILNWINKWRR